MGKKVETDQNDEVEEIVIRSMRSGFTWMDNAIVDDWAHLLGTDILAVYTLYCRRAMNNTQSTRLAQEVVAEHLRVSKTTVSDAMRILEWCGLIRVIRRHRSISKVFLKDTKPLTDELRASLREQIAAGNDYIHLRTMLMSRLDAFLSLGQRLDLFVAKSEKQKIKLVRADELKPEALPLPEPVTAAPSTNGNGSQPPAAEPWRGVLERARMQLPRATFDAWLANTRLLEIEGDTWRIGCNSDAAKNFIEGRMMPVLGRCVPEEVELQFMVVEMVE